jgi:hypothetical protein
LKFYCCYYCISICFGSSTSATLHFEISCLQFPFFPHKEYLKSDSSNEDSLDKPELFLLELSRIPAFEERIYCLVYQNKFHEAITSVDFRLNNVKALCDELVKSLKIKQILGVILACGNSMNASQKLRCDADGFDLAILPKLKDVKSKDNSTTLMHYIAAFYINKIDDDLVNLPLPDSSDFGFVAHVNFEEIEAELKQVQRELKSVEERVESVLKVEGGGDEQAMKKREELNEAFRKKMQEFLGRSNEELKEQEESLLRCKLGFKKVTEVFGVKPKGGESEVTTEYFFSLWATFSQDFKHAWKREGQVFTKIK